jgi:hypothetical protein
MSYLKITFSDVKFLMGKDKPSLNINYTQYNYMNIPNRIAYIDSSMYGIPFEGLDSYVNGTGSMKGVIAKNFTLFNQKGAAMNRASLVTYLAESLLIPNVVLQDFITWEEIDNLHAKATISSYGITSSGIFTFDENGGMSVFTTDDREYTVGDGKSQKVKWSVIVGNYKEANGLKMPTVLQAVWHFDDGDLIYFDGNNFTIEYFR